MSEHSSRGQPLRFVPALICLLLAAPALFPCDARAQADQEPLTRIRRLLDTRDYLAAETELRAIVSSEPRNAEAWELLGRVRQGRWDYPGAADAYRRAIDLGRETAPLLRGWVEAKGRSASGVALALTAGRLRRDLERALALDPYHVETRGILAAFYYMVPGIFGGDKRRADDLIDDLIELSPADGYYLRGVRAREEKKAEARILGPWEQALEIDPAHTLTLTDLGRFWFDRDSTATAVEYYRRAAESAPADPRVLTSYGRALRRVRRFEESAEAFRQALETDPYWFDARKALAEYYERMEDTAGAIAEYETLRRFNPQYESREIAERLARLRGKNPV